MSITSYSNRKDGTTYLQMLADGSATLDMINDHQWFMNDISVNHSAGVRTIHRTFNVPDPGTLIGTAYVGDVAVATFQTIADRQIVPRGISEGCPLTGGRSYDTGIIVMEWSRPMAINEVRLVMSYEYNLEDQQNELHLFCD